MALLPPVRVRLTVADVKRWYVQQSDRVRNAAGSSSYYRAFVTIVHALQVVGRVVRPYLRFLFFLPRRVHTREREHLQNTQYRRQGPAKTDMTFLFYFSISTRLRVHQRTYSQTRPGQETFPVVF